MPTKTIKSSGGDYTTVAAWESGEDNDLSGTGENIGEIYDVNPTTSTVIAGATNVSATDFRHLTVNSAFRHAGKWDTAKANFQFSSLATVVLDVQEAFAKLSYLQVKNTHATSPTGVIKITNVASVRVEECIAACNVAAGGDDNGGVWVNGASALSTLIRNHVSHGMRNGVYGDNAAQTTEIDNSATVACTKGIRTVGSTGTHMVVKNSYSGGNTNDYDEGGSTTPAWAFTTCMCAQNLTITGVTKSIAYSTANFTNVTAGSQDLHLVSGSALINVGTDLSASFTIDFNGATRPTGASTWDVGPDEFVAASGSTLSAAGAATATFNSTSVATAVLTSTGAGTASFSGKSLTAADLTVSGAATAAFTGTALGSAPITATGTSSAAFTSTSLASGAISSTGAGTAAFTGTSVASGALNAQGASTVSWVGTSQSAGAADWSAAGVSTVSMVGASLASGDLAAAGSASASFESVSTEEVVVAPPGTVPPDGGAWPRRSSLHRRKLKEEDDELIAMVKQLAPELMRHYRKPH